MRCSQPLMFTPSIHTMIGVSLITLHRRRVELGLEEDISEIADQELDVFVKSILDLLPVVAIFDHAKPRYLSSSICDFDI